MSASAVAEIASRVESDVPEVTLWELVWAVTEVADDEREVVATVAHMLTSGSVRVIGWSRVPEPPASRIPFIIDLPLRRLGSARRLCARVCDGAALPAGDHNKGIRSARPASTGGPVAHELPPEAVQGSAAPRLPFPRSEPTASGEAHEDGSRVASQRRAARLIGPD